MATHLVQGLHSQTQRLQATLAGMAGVNLVTRSNFVVRLKKS